ncbi:MAG: sigma factor, partial [Gemmatimonadota bacterium]
MAHPFALPWPEGPAASVPASAIPEKSGLQLDRQEAALLARVQQGDNSAFDPVVRAHIRPAYRIAYRLLKGHEDAEDLVQEAFT